MNPFWSLVAIVLIFILSELSYTYIENPLRKGIQGLKIKSYKPLIVVASFSLIGTIGLFTAFSSKQADRNLFAEQLKKELVKKNAEVKRQNSIAQSNRELSSFISANQSNPLNDQQKDFIKNIGINEIQFKKGANKKITGIGDSVMLAISPDLQFIFPQAVINAQVGRHTLDVIPILQQLKEQKKLDNNILMMIGMNGEIKPEQIDQIKKIIGKKRQVYWVNNYAAGRVWIDPNNQVLKDAAKKMQNLHIIDWFDIVNKNNNLVVQDGVHPTQDGTRIITREIINQILK
jgi:chorismate mutase